MDPDRRRFLAATVALATSGLGLSAASGVVSSGGYELVPTEFESQEVLKVRPAEPEPAPRRNYLCEAKALGFQVCPPRPCGSDIYPSSREGEPHYGYWSCCISDDLFISQETLDDPCFDFPGFAAHMEKATLAAWDQWRSWIASDAQQGMTLSPQDTQRTHRYITSPTITHYGVAGGRHFYTFFHVSRGELYPTTPENYYSTARWIASRLIGLPPADQMFILCKIRDDNEILHSMVKLTLRQWHDDALKGLKSLAIEITKPVDHIDLHLTI